MIFLWPNPEGPVRTKNDNYSANYKVLIMTLTIKAHGDQMSALHNLTLLQPKIKLGQNGTLYTYALCTM